MSRAASGPIVVHGWTLYAHPLFLAQLETLAAKVEVLQQNNPQGYRNKQVTKRLAAITRLVFDLIPQDPTRPAYRQGATLGKAHKHWFRAKFFQRYRLFFRYHSDSRVIVFAWVNDTKTLRAYGSNHDAYRVFRRMLESGNPPDTWSQLLSERNAAGELYMRS